jgi:hypothetical protein
MQKQNVGPLDRVIRIFLGLLLIGIRYLGQIPGITGDVMVLIGAVEVWQGLVGYCLIYGFFNWSTKLR